jgi:hypothetical protein
MTKVAAWAFERERLMTEFTVVVDNMSLLEGPRWTANRIWVSDCYMHRIVSEVERRPVPVSRSWPPGSP